MMHCRHPHMKFLFAALLLLLCAFGIAYFLTGPSAIDFCSGTNKHEISRIEIQGQMRRAILSDPIALAYLQTLPKVNIFPGETPRPSVYTFTITIYDKWGRKSSMPVMISTDGRVLEFIYTKTLFGIPQHVFSMADTNAPFRFREMLNFLLDERNGDKEWKDGIRK
jgi:hypothetical protein